MYQPSIFDGWYFFIQKKTIQERRKGGYANAG